MQPGSIGWIAIAAVIIGALVRLVKTDTINVFLAQYLGQPPIPKRALPFIAFALGVASAALQMKVQGSTWQQAALGGLASAATAIAGHETMVESAFGGAELFSGGTPPKPGAPSAVATGAAMIVGLTLASGIAGFVHAPTTFQVGVTACTPATQQAAVQDATEGALTAQELACVQDAGSRAEADACRDRVKASFGVFDGGAR